MTKKHYIALVPMGGASEGKIAQHSTMAESIEAAADWAENRFSRSCIIVEMNSEDEEMPLDGLVGKKKIYKMNNNRGGKRPGAGRKKKGESGMISLYVPKHISEAWVKLEKKKRNELKDLFIKGIEPTGISGALATSS